MRAWGMWVVAAALLAALLAAAPALAVSLKVTGPWLYDYNISNSSTYPVSGNYIALSGQIVSVSGNEFVMPVVAVNYTISPVYRSVSDIIILTFNGSYLLGQILELPGNITAGSPLSASSAVSPLGPAGPLGTFYLAVATTSSGTTVAYMVSYATLRTLYAALSGSTLYIATSLARGIFPTYYDYPTFVPFPGPSTGTILSHTNWTGVLVAAFSLPGTTLQWATDINMTGVGASPALAGSEAASIVWGVTATPSGPVVYGTLIMDNGSYYLSLLPYPFIAWLNTTGGLVKAVVPVANISYVYLVPLYVEPTSTGYKVVGSILQLLPWSGPLYVAYNATPAIVYMSGGYARKILVFNVKGNQFGYFWREVECGQVDYLVGVATKVLQYWQVVDSGVLVVARDPATGRVLWSRIIYYPGNATNHVPVVTGVACWGSNLVIGGVWYQGSLDTTVQYAQGYVMVVKPDGSVAGLWLQEPPRDIPSTVTVYVAGLVASGPKLVAAEMRAYGLNRAEPAVSPAPLANALLVEPNVTVASVVVGGWRDPLNFTEVDVTAYLTATPITLKPVAKTVPVLVGRASVTVDAWSRDPYTPVMYVNSSAGVIAYVDSTGRVHLLFGETRFGPLLGAGKPVLLYVGGIPNATVMGLGSYPLVALANSSSVLGGFDASRGTATLVLKSKGLVAIATPLGGLYAVKVDGKTLCVGIAECEALRDNTSWVILVDPVNITLYVEPSAELGGTLVPGPLVATAVILAAAVGVVIAAAVVVGRRR